mgnify:CR=1 FL=1
MAGDWIKMQVNLPDKPEVWRIAGMLSIDADAVVGKLLRVWSWFDQNTENGNAPGVTYPLIDRVAGVAGFAEAMVLAGWLEHLGSDLCIPNFGRHNGKTAKNRALTNERVAKSRALSNAEGNAASVTKTVTREEKRRSNTPPTPKGEQAEPAGFVRFWAAWPKSVRKGGKAKCLQTWRRADLEPLAEQIVRHVERMDATPDWTKEGGAYVPAPQVYLNQRRWDGAEVGCRPAEQDRWGGAL